MAKLAVCHCQLLQRKTCINVVHRVLMRGICMLLFIAGLVSCKNGKPKAVNPQATVTDSLAMPQGNTADSLEMAHNIDSADYKALFKNKTNIWLYKLLLNKQSKWENFHLTDYWRKDSLTQYDYRPDSTFYEQYAMFLEWSPDSTYIFDHGSYGVEMARDDKGRLYAASGDADVEIALINRKTNKKARLLFFGIGSGEIAAHWIDTVQVAFLGWEGGDETGGHPDTLLWIINVKDKFFRKYKYQPSKL